MKDKEDNGDGHNDIKMQRRTDFATMLVTIIV
jgi:hypothetical protein